MAKGLLVALKCWMLSIMPNRMERQLRSEEHFQKEMVGSLSNDDGDGDGNEKGKKAIGLDWHNSNFVL